MTEARSSTRIRVSLHRELRLLATELSAQRDMSITIASLLEEGIEGLFETTLTEWAAWAKEGRAPVEMGEQSISFRIRSDLSRKLSVLAAQITKYSGVPITKIHLTEQAGRCIITQIKAELAELEDMFAQ